MTYQAPSSLIVRTADYADIDQLVELTVSKLPYNASDKSRLRQAIQADIDSPRTTILVLEVANIGMAAYSQITKRHLGPVVIDSICAATHSNLRARSETLDLFLVEIFSAARTLAEKYCVKLVFFNCSHKKLVQRCRIVCGRDRSALRFAHTYGTDNWLSFAEKPYSTAMLSLYHYSFLLLRWLMREQILTNNDTFEYVRLFALNRVSGER